jgi:hypothetical protein
MNVLYLSPAYPASMIPFTRGLTEVGCSVLGVGDTPRDALPGDVARYLHDYLEVPKVLDEGDVADRVSHWLRGRSLDRVLTNWEPLVMLAARLRERWGMPGMSVETARGFRDKELMKTRLRAAGLRVPRSRRVHDARETWAAAEEIGYPLILKPIAGAGSADTFRVESKADLERTLPKLGALSQASCEEYIDGEEFTFDTLCLRGKPVMENVTQYFPKPLEAATTEWISPIALSVRDLTQPHLAGGIALGRAALEALGMDSGFTHMEWYRTSNGEAVFGEIACRPGGAGLVDQMNYTCDADYFREWARITAFGYFEGTTVRKFNVGLIFKRALGWGNITRVDGLGDWLRACGGWVVEEGLSRPGTPRRDWTQTQQADGRLIVRHPEWETALQMCRSAARDIQLYAQ